MLKFCRAILGLALLIALSGDSWGQSPRQPPRQNPQGTQQQPGTEQRGTEQAPFIVKIQESEQTKKESSASEGKTYEQRDNAWTLSDKIAAIAIIVGFLQFLALIATVYVMARTARRQLRAYVFPENIGLYDGMMLDPEMPEHANEPGVVLVWRNTGQTPALKVISWGQLAIIEPANEETLITPKLEDIFSSNLGQNGSNSKALWFGRALTADEIRDIGRGAHAIYLYGRIEYRDIFKRPRHTNFRLAYAGPFPPPKGATFRVCQKGNSSE
jgi:hypothetical protein